MLVIVDIQPLFKASKKKTLHKYIIKEIDRAIRYRSYICLLEYEGHGDTLEIISDRCKYYDKLFKCVKCSDDGSIDILDKMNELGINYNRIVNYRICGINTSYCVKETAQGLAIMLPKSNIKIVLNACNCFYKQPKLNWIKGNIQGIYNDKRDFL